MPFGYIDPGTGMTLFSFGAAFLAYLLASLGFALLFAKKIIKFVKKHKRTFLIIAVLIIITAGVSMMGGLMNRQGSAFNHKVIILGFDGLSPEIVEPMMQSGQLPNFSKLRSQGSYSKLATTNPSQSPVAWTGFATGNNPAKSGVFDFIVRDPKDYRLQLSLSNIKNGRPRPVVKCKSFWHYTSERKIPTIIISCPITFPADKIYGRMLSGMGVPDALGTEGTFTFYTSEALTKAKDTGGNTIKINRAPIMKLQLIGPRVAALGGKKENVKVPFEVLLPREEDKAIIKLGSKKIVLSPGQWSRWQEVNFKLGLFKRMKGIFKFYLVQTRPEFKLYISPINLDPRRPFFNISHPANYSRELAAELGLFYTQGMPMDTWAVNEKRLSERPFLEQVNEVLREKKAMLDFELGRFDKGMLFCYFESPDIIQHMFWRYSDPQHPLYEKDATEEYKQKIRQWYKEMDAVLGKVLKEIGQGDILLVLSDHGFNTFRRTVHLNTWLRQNGYLTLKYSAGGFGRELLSDIDWQKTKAYAIGFGAIYINQQGREGQGIVRAKEVQGLKEEIAGKLAGWVDSKYNQPVVSRVYKREEIFWGPHVEQTPDLYVGFNIGYRASWQTALGAAPDNLIEDNLKKWSGSHLFDPALVPGILLCNQKLAKSSPSLYDFAPTILQIAGYSEKEINSLGFDGSPLFK